MKNKVCSLENLFQQIIKEYKKLIEDYCEKPNLNLDDFFKTFLDFYNSLIKVKKEVELILLNEEKIALINQQMNSSI